MPMNLAHALQVIAGTDDPDKIVHRVSLRLLSLRVEEALQQLAGKPLGFVLILCDDETHAAGSISNLPPDEGVDLVSSWLESLIDLDDERN